MIDSDDDFSRFLGDDVVPLATEKRVVLKKTPLEDAQSLQQRRLSAEQEQQTAADPLSTRPSELVDPNATISFQRNGVQHGVLKNLRLGKYRIDATLDLHKKSVEQARQEVHQFVKDCVTHDVRTALITHGKGEGRAQPAMLKSCVAYWLPQMEDVLAFHSAIRQHGGYGATYILLKKSEKKKQELRERHGAPYKGE